MFTLSTVSKPPFIYTFHPPDLGLDPIGSSRDLNLTQIVLMFVGHVKEGGRSALLAGCEIWRAVGGRLGMRAGGEAMSNPPCPQDKLIFGSPSHTMSI